MKLIRTGRLKLKQVKSRDLHKVTFIIENISDTIIANIVGGNLLIPELTDKKGSQTLVIKKNKDLVIRPGIGEH